MSAKLVVPAEVFSRISGYFRPVNQWNRGKQEEFKNRKVVDPGLLDLKSASNACLCSNAKESSYLMG